MDDHSGLSRPNGPSHLKTFNSNTNLQNGSPYYPTHPQPRMSYNPTYANSNKELPNYR